MIRKIEHAARDYFALLNMDPDAVTIRKRYIEHDTREYKGIWKNILLFILTILTTTVAGAVSGESIGAILLSGLPFSMTLMAILLSHEMGHYLTARYFGVKATLPYFIPFPPLASPAIGTMGAVIKLKSPIYDRRSLLYIGAMGPLAGFVLSLIACIAGIYLSEIKPAPASTNGLVPVLGDSLLFALLTRIIHGGIRPGYDIYLSSYAWAGWIGFLVTSLNLMPMGQLDGSRVVYALIGRSQVYIGWAVFTALVIMSFIWPGWIVWIIMALAFLRIGHPPVEGESVLSAGEKMIGWLCILIFVICFMPVPVKFV